MRRIKGAKNSGPDIYKNHKEKVISGKLLKVTV